MPFRDPVLALEEKLRAQLEARRELDASIRENTRTLELFRRAAAGPDRAWPKLTTEGVLLGVAVLLAVSLLAAAVAGRGCTGDRVGATRTEALAIRTAALGYVLVHPMAECPHLGALIEGGYLDSSMRTVDVWGSPFSIACEGDDVRVVSPGPDETLGTDDDIE